MTSELKEEKKSLLYVVSLQVKYIIIKWMATVNKLNGPDFEKMKNKKKSFMSSSIVDIDFSRKAYPNREDELSSKHSYIRQT